VFCKRVFYIIIGRASRKMYNHSVKKEHQKLRR